MYRDDENNAIEVYSVTLTRTINNDGQQGFTMTTPQQFSFIEVMGLLEAAKWQLFNQMTKRYGGLD